MGRYRLVIAPHVAHGQNELLSVVEMGGSGTSSEESRVSEAAVRGFWKAYRQYMNM